MQQLDVGFFKPYFVRKALRLRPGFRDSLFLLLKEFSRVGTKSLETTYHFTNPQRPLSLEPLNTNPIEMRYPAVPKKLRGGRVQHCLINETISGERMSLWGLSG